MSGLHRRNSGVLGRGNLDQLLCTPFFSAADVQVIAHQKQERLLFGKIPGAEDCMTVARSERSVRRNEAGLPHLLPAAA